MDKQNSGNSSTHDEPYFKPNQGSVFPKLRKLVMTMMGEAIASFFHSEASSDGTKVADQNLLKGKATGSNNKVNPSKVPYEK